MLIAIKEKHSGWIKSKIDNKQAQVMTAEIYIHNKHRIHITNIYRKQINRRKVDGTQFWEMLDSSLVDHVLVGDINAHHTLWSSPDNKLCDPVGEVIAEGIIEENFILHNNNQITLRNAREGGRDTTVDLTFSKNQKILKFKSWETLEPHGSDHHVILSRWGKLQEEVSGNNIFKLLRDEPRIIEKNVLKVQYKEIRNCFTKLLKRKKEKYKHEQIEKITEAHNDTQLWGFIKAFEGQYGAGGGLPPINDINDVLVTNNLDKANTLGKHYSKISSNSNYSPSFQIIKEQHKLIHENLLTKNKNDSDIHNYPITLKELKKVINKKKQNSAPGEDNISYQIFKNLPISALNTLVHFFNIIWTSGNIPKQFKHAIIVPIHKPEKDPKQPASYRPIALTDHLGKLLETIVNDRLVHFLESKGIISKNQSGFRAKRQCMDQLARLVSEVDKSRKLNRQTAAVFLDLEKAYDMLWREGTLAELQSLGVKGQMYNYIMDFLTDRTFQVRVGDTISDKYIQETGTPQGAVLSPTIFNVLINKATKSLKKYKHISVGQYADDSAIWLRAKYAPRRLYSKHKKRFRHLSIQRTKLLLKGPTEDFISCLEGNGFKVNVEKTQCLFFDSDSNPEMEINGKQVRATDSARYLGVILDKKLSFNKHIKMLRNRGLKSMRILSYMTGKKWGLKAKHRRLLYTNYILPKFSYGEEIFDTAAKSNLKLLDVVQNQALRLITKVIKPTKSELLPILAR